MIPEAAGEVFGARAELANRYVDILASRGIEWGLIGPREVARLWERHVLNSVALAGLVRQDAMVVDVGSGAGLPGIPLAIAREDLRVTLVDSLLRRVNFLDEVVAELELGGRVTVVRSRAEDLGIRVDVVTARAVAPLARLIGWTKQLFVPNGELLAVKGSSAEAEVAAAAAVLAKSRLAAEVLEVRASAGSESTRVVRVRAAVGASR